MPGARLILEVDTGNELVKEIQLSTLFSAEYEYQAVNALVEQLRERLKNAHNTALSAAGVLDKTAPSPVLVGLVAPERESPYPPGG